MGSANPDGSAGAGLVSIGGCSARLRAALARIETGHGGNDIGTHAERTTAGGRCSFVCGMNANQIAMAEAIRPLDPAFWHLFALRGVSSGRNVIPFVDVSYCGDVGLDLGNRQPANSGRARRRLFLRVSLPPGGPKATIGPWETHPWATPLRDLLADPDRRGAGNP